MPAPITHIVLALSVLPLLPGKESGAFIRGSSFPDIRYCLKQLSRESTHVKQVCWVDIQKEPSSFKSGVLFHSLVDHLTNPFLDHAYAALQAPNPNYKGYFLKLFQDIILYDMVDDWPTIAEYFDHVDQEIFDYHVSQAEILAWHQKLKTYFIQKPTVETVIAIIGNDVIQQQETFACKHALQQALENSSLEQPILTFYRDFLKQLK